MRDARSVPTPHVGIIGGLGPLASAEFYRRFVVACRRESDQSHPEVTLVSSPAIPDRLRYLADPQNPDPVPRIVEVATRLVSDGCTLLAMPSITTHALYTRVQDRLTTPIVNMLDAVADGVRRQGYATVTALMTDGARTSGLLQARLEAAEVEVLLPSTELQSRVQGVVESVKRGGDLGEVEDELARIVAALRREAPKAAQPLIGCTDISPAAVRLGLLDVSQIYADAVARRIDAP